jgi:hypothetical protein
MMQVSRKMDFSIPFHWVVVDLVGGIGNQLLQAVTALMVALISGRGLAINHVTRNLNSRNNSFAFDSVLGLPTPNDLNSAGVFNSKPSIKLSHKYKVVSHARTSFSFHLW